MKYIVIINKDTPRLVTKISELLGKQKININSIEANLEHGFAKIKLYTLDNDLSLNILNENGFKSVSDKNILLRVEDKPDALGHISQQLSQKNINICAISMIEQNHGSNIISIVTDSADRSREIFKDINICKRHYHV